MLSLNPADIVTKLKTLFEVVICLFGGMWAGAALGFFFDRRARARALRRLTAPEAGFRVTEDGVWLWRFHLDELEEELAPPTGSAVRLSAIIGMPYVRLRAALPDELISTNLAAALGRRHSFSVSGMVSSLPEQKDVLRSLSRRMDASARKSTRVSAITPRASVLQRESEQRQKLEELVGSALVMAYLQSTQLMPVLELAEHRAAAAKYFEGTVTPAGWDFAKMNIMFVSVVAPGMLNTHAKWLLRARLWRLILSQNVEGWWDATRTSAFALEARSMEEVENLPDTVFTRALNLLRGATEIAVEDEDDAKEGHAASRVLSSALEERVRGKVLKEDQLRVLDEFEEEKAENVYDCPLTNSAHSIVSSIPHRLRLLGAEHAHINVARVWTTMCCIKVLEVQRTCWIWGDGDLCVTRAVPACAARALPC